MLKIRLQRKGKKKQAFFRIVLQEHTEKLGGKYLELLGHYDPHSKELKIDAERVEYWVSKGAQVSPTLNNIMVNQKIWDRPKMKSWHPKKKGQSEEATKPAEAAPAAAMPQTPAEGGEKAAPKAQEPVAESQQGVSAETAPIEEKKEDDTTKEAAGAVA